MRYHRAWAAGLLIAAVVLGCGPAKELPDETPASTERGQDSGTAPESIPARSDPAAVEIVDRAIKAHTQNNPSLLAKGKVSRVTADGIVKIPVRDATENIPVQAKRTFLARWPDEIKYVIDFKPPQSGNRTLILRGRFIWTGNSGVPDPNLNPRKTEEDMRADGFGLQWLVLLFPLREQKTVVYDPQKGVGVGTPPADVVRVAIAGQPVYRLHISPRTGFLTQIDYHFTYLLGPAYVEWMLSDHKDFGGMLLPTQMKLARTTERPRFRDIVEDWKVESWEFPDRLDDSAFEAPK